MIRVVMLLSNAFRPDPRVAREVQALADAGPQVTIICWDRAAKYPAREVVGDYQIERIQKVQTVYGAGARQILYIPRFWRAAAARVRELHPDVIHCHDLDTLPAGWWLKGRIGAKLVYDAHEDYPAMMSLYLPGPMVSMLSWLERYLLHRVDYTITASTVFADKLRDQGVRPVTTIGNYQSLEPFDALTETEILAARADLGLQPDDLALVYIGGFSRNRQLLPLIEAARNLPDVRVFLWGDGHQRDQVVSSAAQVPNVKYLGWLSSEDVPLYTSAADVIYYCLLPNYPGAVYNAPNTLSNAMAAGCPIIANDVGDLGRIIRQNGCGLLLSEVTPAHICQAVEELKDPIVRQQMGIAGRRAAETFYNWAIAGDELEQVYAKLMDERELE